MTQKSGNYTYASRVYGSSAYALDPAPVYEDHPVTEPPAKKNKTRTAKRVERRPKNIWTISLFGIFGFVSVAALVVFCLFNYVQFAGVSAEVSQLGEELIEYREEGSKLLINYEKTFDINEVEDYATNILGMVKPDSEQKQVIMTAAEDRAEIIVPEKSEISFISGLSSFLASVVEYFK
jgi:hypothetical protein